MAMAYAHDNADCPPAGDPLLVLVHPARLPRRLAELASAGRRLRYEAELWAAVGTGALSAGVALDRFVARSSPVGPPPVVTGAAPPPRAGDYGDEYDEHDAFFGVTRTSRRAGETFLRSTMRTHQLAVAHQRQHGCGSAPERAVLRRGWHCLLGHAFGAATTPSCDGYDPETESDLVDCPVPHEHWRVGHQLFFVLIQGIVAGVRCAVDAIDSGDPVGADRGLRLAADMCHHSAVAMKFAGSLSVADYEHAVRPSMLPPAVRPGFSGFQTRDHALLVKSLRAARPALSRLGFGHPGVVALQGALERVYAAHH